MDYLSTLPVEPTAQDVRDWLYGVRRRGLSEDEEANLSSGPLTNDATIRRFWALSTARGFFLKEAEHILLHLFTVTKMGGRKSQTA